MNKKAQLAVETLLIYGLAILIVMIAIGTLWATGYLNFDQFIGDSCRISSELGCGEYVVRSDTANPEQVQLEIENTYGSTVFINSIEITGIDDSEGILNTCNLVFDNADGIPNTADDPKAIPNGEMHLFNFAGCGGLSSFVGKKVKAGIEVNWNKAGSEIHRTAFGELRATVSE